MALHRFPIKFQVLGWRHIFFDLRATNISVTLENLRLFTDVINNPEGVSKLLFSFQFVIFNRLSYCFKGRTGFDVKTSFARILINGYSVPRDFSWIENYKLIWVVKEQQWKHSISLILKGSFGPFRPPPDIEHNEDPNARSI